MTAERQGRLTLTKREAEVFRIIAAGDVEVGPATRSFRRRGSDPFGPGHVDVQQVERATAKRLERAGLVAIVHGVASLTDAGRAALQEGHRRG